MKEENPLSLEFRVNMLSADKQIARDSWGQHFKIGEIVGHESDNNELPILSFEQDIKSNEIKAITSAGWAHLDFIVKL